MSHFKKNLICILLILSFFLQTPVYAHSTGKSSFSCVILSVYQSTVKIGDEFFIVALTSTGKKPSWKSSNSRIASVNTYGKVTAKNTGTALITAKIKDAEASCNVTVTPTEITLSNTSITLEHGETFTLKGTTSNRSKIKWNSSKKSIATVTENGTITALKPGDTVITAKADSTTVTCKVKVKKPTLRISQTAVSLYRTEQVKLFATASSGLTPTWKSSKKSVATVSERGMVTAVKHGLAKITATLDGVTVTCYITVKQPKISLNKSNLSLKKGEYKELKADVSSGNSPQWMSSNTSVATVSNGTVTAVSKGKANIYAIEDGMKAKCSVVVTE